MQFSSGDLVAVVIGSVAVIKWGIDIFNRKGERTEDAMVREEGKLTQLLSDFAAHKAEDRTEFRYITLGLGDIRKDITRLEVKVESLQAQIRNVASGGNNKITQIGEDR